MRAEEQLPATAECILMFSGGRDSSLAALSLAAAGRPMALVTVSADHLFGIERVQQRLAEMEHRLPKGSQWIHIRQPRTPAEFSGPLLRTCLPCQHDYAFAGAIMAKSLAAARLAFGYAHYQSDWPEQHPMATAALSTVLGEFGVHLELPVYAIASRDEAIAKLTAAGLDSRALEQKCSRQIFNVPLGADVLELQIAQWADALRASLTRNVEIEVIEQRSLQRVDGP